MNYCHHLPPFYLELPPFLSMSALGIPHIPTLGTHINLAPCVSPLQSTFVQHGTRILPPPSVLPPFPYLTTPDQPNVALNLTHVKFRCDSPHAAIISIRTLLWGVGSSQGPDHGEHAPSYLSGYLRARSTWASRFEDVGWHRQLPLHILPSTAVSVIYTNNLEVKGTGTSVNLTLD